MRLLVLGGTHHVGRAVVEEALARGDEVTTLTRGESGEPAVGAESRHADRTDPQQLSSALGADTWEQQRRCRSQEAHLRDSVRGGGADDEADRAAAGIPALGGFDDALVQRDPSCGRGPVEEVASAWVARADEHE